MSVQVSVRVRVLGLVVLLTAGVVGVFMRSVPPGPPPPPAAASVPLPPADGGRADVEGQPRTVAVAHGGDEDVPPTAPGAQQGRKWWDEIVAHAPKDVKAPHYPTEPKAFLHFVLSTRTAPKSRWPLRLQDLLKDRDVNPGGRAVSPEIQRELQSQLAPFRESLQLLASEFDGEIVDAWHHQIERGGFVEVDASDGGLESTAKAVAELEKTIGKLNRDHYRISVSAVTPGHHALIYATAQTAPAAFRLVPEIERVLTEARVAARHYLAAH